MIWLVGALILLASAGALATRLRIAIINGSSMRPTLDDGDRVLVRRIRAGAVRCGDVVLVARAGPETDWIVKRVAALPGDPAPAGLPGSRVPVGMLVLLGDNPPHSADSRDFGYVPAERLFGVVIRRLPPAR